MNELSDVERFVIEKAKELRIKAGLSQKDLSLKMGYSEGFVGNIENPRRREKYNLRHLNELSVALGCSPKDLLPNVPYKITHL